MEPQNSRTKIDSNANKINSHFNCSIKLNNICSPNNDNKIIQKACGKGMNSNIFRCNTKCCKFKLDFYPSDPFCNISNQENI